MLSSPGVSDVATVRTRTASGLPTVAVVGLGYVGLPVAVEFGKQRPTIGYDSSRQKTEDIRRQVDASGEVSPLELTRARHLQVSSDPAVLAAADFVIVAVPTPVN